MFFFKKGKQRRFFWEKGPSGKVGQVESLLYQRGPQLTGTKFCPERDWT